MRAECGQAAVPVVDWGYRVLETRHCLNEALLPTLLWLTNPTPNTPSVRNTCKKSVLAGLRIKPLTETLLHAVRVCGATQLREQHANGMPMVHGWGPTRSVAARKEWPFRFNPLRLTCSRQDLTHSS